MTDTAASEPICVDLSRDEVLVLFDLLARFEETKLLKLKRNSEFLAISALAARLQSVLVEPFEPNYRHLIAEASARLEAGYEGLAPGVEP